MKRCIGWVLAGMWMVSAGAWGGQPAAPDSGFSAGVSVTRETRLDEIGLPAYPGATVHKGGHDDMPAITFGLWGGSFGLKVAVLEFDSTATVEDIAAYYLAALHTYGAVLDCSKPTAHRNDDDERWLSCDSDEPKAGGRTFKVGTPKNQRVVDIKPHGDHVEFSLVRIVVRGTD